MKKTLIIASLVVLAIFLMGFSWYASTSNSLVAKDETVMEKWAQVENAYQRRSDLIPNLVSTVKGYAKHEASVLEEVTRARAQVGQVRNTTSDLNKYDQAQSQLGGALSRLLVVAEKYPDLKANQNFIELQSQLEGTENRISVERMRFNEATKDFNAYLRSFPQSIVAQRKGYHERAYFQSQAGAQNAPKVEF